MLPTSDLLPRGSCAFVCCQRGLSFMILWLLCCVSVVALLRCVAVFSCCARLSFGRLRVVLCACFVLGGVAVV